MNKKNYLLILLLAMTAVASQAQKYLGGDISLLTKYEENKALYYEKNGAKITDVIQFLKAQGMNSMRLRLFVDPTKAPADHKAEGVCQDLDYVKALGKRIKDAGLHFLLDFHYSDTWTDPGKHATPDAWKSLTTTQLAEMMYSYTKECLETLIEGGAQPDAIQVGNELNLGQLWDSGKTWPTDPSSQKMSNFISCINNAVKACHDVCPQAKVVFHVAMNYRSKGNSNNNDQARNWASLLKTKGVDYDIFGLSYYPYYHGALSELETLITALGKSIPEKKIQLVEVGYPNAWYPSDNQFDYTSTYPATEEGQRSFTKDLITLLNKYPQVNGLYWWYPEANGNYFSSSWYNMGLWNNSNHRALKALYELRAFMGDPSAIHTQRADNRLSVADRYNLQGQRVGDNFRGVVIAYGNKMIAK